MAEKYLLEKQDLETRMEKSLPDITIEDSKLKPQIKVSIDEKIKLAEEKKRLKDAEKQQIALEKKLVREATKLSKIKK